tara:strand:- start:224 stop:523 length:300 start_codon:yes stop_codon:yes gene_type:complete
MKRHEEYMKQAMKQSDVGSPEDYPPSADMVNSPPHYNQSGIECIEAIQAALGPNFKYYLQGNIMKYLWRFDYKSKPIEDLDKADWYLERLREEVVANES